MKKNIFKGKKNFGFLVPSVPRELWEKIETEKVYTYHRSLASPPEKVRLFLDRLKRSDLESSMGLDRSGMRKKGEDDLG